MQVFEPLAVGYLLSKTWEGVINPELKAFMSTEAPLS
jgi:hypothetical protein